MVRMSDILKKALEKKKEGEKRPLSSVEPVAGGEVLSQTPPIIIPPVPVDQEPEPVIKEELPGTEEKYAQAGNEIKNNISDIRISPLVAKKISQEESAKLYEELLLLMKDTLKNISERNFIESNIVEDKIEKLAGQLLLDNEYLPMLAFIKDSIDSNYLLCHSVNVCIYSIEIGIGLDYGKSKLIELGIAALLHDVGMEKFLDIVQSQKILTSEEYDKMKEHSLLGLQALGNSSNYYKIANQVAYQHHERLDGSGYPLGKSGEDIVEYAKIVGLVDIYEAMVHSRLYRQRKTVTEVVQEILNAKGKFEHKLIKVLMERIGIFPLGCFIRLNNKEIAQVIKLNYGVPLRPVIRIILDSNGKQVPERKIVDLATQPTVYIKSEEKINWDWVKF